MVLAPKDIWTIERVSGGMSEANPQDDPPYTYECLDCGHRVEARHQPSECEECGGEMLNISVSREH